jgi:hypothetical protein
VYTEPSNDQNTSKSATRSCESLWGTQRVQARQWPATVRPFGVLASQTREPRGQVTLQSGERGAASAQIPMSTHRHPQKLSQQTDEIPISTHPDHQTLSVRSPNPLRRQALSLCRTTAFRGAKLSTSSSVEHSTSQGGA